MGQTPSRMQIRRNGLAKARSDMPSSESQSSSELSTSVPNPSSSSVSEPQAASIAEAKRSRRASLPHRLLSSLAPKTSTSETPRTRTTSSATQSSQRKKWRLSRRISKPPIANDIPIREVAESQDEQSRSQDSPVEVESGKGKAREDEAVDDFPSAPEASTSLSPPIEAVASITSGGRFVEPDSDIPFQPISTASRQCSEEDQDEVVIAPSTELVDSSPQTHVVPPLNQSEGPPFMPPIAPAGSQPPFPPAGTLVVVQGVVHTTDVSRALEANSANNNSNNPNSVIDGGLEPPGIGRSLISRQRSSSTPGDRMRNRLSGILPRPSSMLPSVPLMSEDGTAVDRTAADYPQQPPVDTQSSTATLAGGTGSNTGGGPATSEISNPGSLSPSSIDVLGTLLSVAAAATAASLLTGTSEPIFSSGLAPLSQSPNQPPPQSVSDRPLSPTPTGDAGRMRHVWSSLRDRLGLRTPGMGASGTDEGAGRPSPRDASGGRPPVVSGVANASAEAAAVNGGGISDVPVMPPPGSFERFLIDLQSDLRVALAQESVPADADTEGDNEDVGDEDGHEGEHHEETGDVPDGASDNESFDTAASDIDDNMPELQSVSDEASTISDAHTARESPGTNGDGLGNGGDPDLEIRNAAVRDTTATLPHVAHADTLSGEASTGIGSQEASSGFHGGAVTDPLSSLSSGPPPGVSSFTESSTAAQESETDMPFRLPRFSPGSASRTEHTPINWWRLYRFPAITAPASRSTQGPTIVQQGSAPQPQPHVDDQEGQNTGAAPAAPSLSSTPSEMSDTAHATLDANLNAGVQSSDGNANGNEQRNVVIPVIVVGLQSVHAERQPPMPPHPPHHLHHPHVHHHPADFVDEHHTEGDMMDLDFGSESGMSPSTTAPTAPSEFSPEDTRQSRGRSWQSRAADAIRNLRPGRRATVTRNPATEVPGSRTFLIYVIGGYYPPDHQIITGGNLDSFEALWELAELLGQVKPPTVSKEEIAKSGLEVIKADSLEEYAKDGRVANNCVDRCLICLDDYVPDEDLRVLSCKHAFHQGCVDKWLQTGRNNCPACRSKGVENETSPSAEPSASSSTAMPQPAAA
ncbi:uncharacterized protein EDB91DRAFT_1126291 [Suillus paluster]|uniref:uncharacterized protein n=1 Tax=Suillus paluster TaxID=48578 RepID=UPI001B877351|nr:uncharacterized protein EDB91DRAFT_1126291 [Suillus paluster]KAG1743218.1 hypothetical protein EDB91DRAFT_1126291 [Suillus paluster]